MQRNYNPFKPSFFAKIPAAVTAKNIASRLNIDALICFAKTNHANLLAALPYLQAYRDELLTGMQFFVHNDQLVARVGNHVTLFFGRDDNDQTKALVCSFPSFKLTNVTPVFISANSISVLVEEESVGTFLRESSHRGEIGYSAPLTYTKGTIKAMVPNSLYGILSNDTLYKLNVAKNYKNKPIFTFPAGSQPIKMTDRLIFTTDGLYALGNNSYGELGLGHFNTCKTPVKIPNISPSVTYASHVDSSLVVQTDSGLFGCGKRFHCNTLTPLDGVQGKIKQVTVCWFKQYVLILTDQGLYEQDHHILNKFLPLIFLEEILQVVANQYPANTWVLTKRGLYGRGDNREFTLCMGRNKNTYNTFTFLNNQPDAVKKFWFDYSSDLGRYTGWVITESNHIYIFGYAHDNKLGNSNNHVEQWILLPVEKMQGQKILSSVSDKVSRLILTTRGLYGFNRDRYFDRQEETDNGHDRTNSVPHLRKALFQFRQLEVLIKIGLSLEAKNNAVTVTAKKPTDLFALIAPLCAFGDSQILRKATAAFILSKLDMLSAIIVTPQNMTYDAYANYIERGDIAGSYDEIRILMHLLKRPILVVNEDEELINREAMLPFSTQGEPIFLKFKNEKYCLYDTGENNTVELFLASQDNFKLRHSAAKREKPTNTDEAWLASLFYSAEENSEEERAGSSNQTAALKRKSLIG